MNVNVLAVLLGTVLYMFLGWLWYSPMLFAKPWTKLTGKKMEEMKGASTGYLYAGASALVMSFVMAVFVRLTGGATVADGIKTGVWAWIGFVATTHITNYTFEGRPIKLYWISVGYPLVGLILLGALFASWH